MNSRKLRVVALADSLALPRGLDSEAEIVRWEDTWPYRLEGLLADQRPDVEVINCGGRDRTVESLVGGDFQDHVLFKRPDILVIQLGVADGAPRIFSRFEKRLLNLPIVPRWYRERLIRRRSARRAQLIAKNPLAKVHVPPAVFTSYLQRFAKSLAELARPPRVLFIPVVGNMEFMDRKSPGFSSNAATYNRILETVAEQHGYLLLPWRAQSEQVTADGYHLNVAGNDSLARAIAAAVAPWLQMRPASVVEEIACPETC